mgnify:CR=1 FL=1
MTLSGKFGFLKGNPIKSLASSSKESFLASINNEKRLFEELKKLIAKEGEEKCEVLYSRSIYDPRRKYISKEADRKHIYPCVYLINSKSELKLIFSSENRGHFGIKKLIWSNGSINSLGSFIDKEGKYGLTCFSFAIVDEEENLENIKKAFDSKKFRELMEYCTLLYSINHKIIQLFRKDFWKEFIND